MLPGSARNQNSSMIMLMAPGFKQNKLCTQSVSPNHIYGNLSTDQWVWTQTLSQCILKSLRSWPSPIRSFSSCSKSSQPTRHSVLHWEATKLDIFGAGRMSGGKFLRPCHQVWALDDSFLSVHGLEVIMVVPAQIVFVGAFKDVVKDLLTQLAWKC